MLSIRSILVMPSQCSICRLLINSDHRKHKFADIHPASELEIACPAPISGSRRKRCLAVANLDTSNVLRPLEILTSALGTVSFPLDQSRRGETTICSPFALFYAILVITREMFELQGDIRALYTRYFVTSPSALPSLRK